MNNDPSSEPYDWSLKPSSAHPGTSVYSTMTPTQPRVYPAQDLLSPTHQAMQQIDTPMARAYHIAAPESSPSSPGEYRPRALPSPHRFNTNLPDKRPRLLSTADNRTVETGDELETSADRNDLGRYSQRRQSPQSQEVFPILGGASESVDASCLECSGSKYLIQDMVQGFIDLRSEILFALSLTPGLFPVKSSELSKLDLKQSLAWTIQEIHDTLRLVRGNTHTHTATKPELPPLADVVASPFASDNQAVSPHIYGPTVPRAISDLRRMSLHQDPSRTKNFQRRGPELPLDPTPRPLDLSLPSLMPADDMRRSQHPDQITSGRGQSPYPSSASSVFGSAQSPMQSQPSSRTLPSPPGQHFAAGSASAAVPYSPTAAAAAAAAAHNSHLQELQHQISTKSLALQTLQREHDQLLSAFSRSQIRCTALEKKSRVADHEINTLTEDKLRLQQQVEELESQVNDLMKSRDEVHQQSTADGAQWRQIMAMSSQLQMKGADEARRFKQEKDAWQRDRDLLQKRIEALESGKVNLPEANPVSGSTTPVASSSILTSDSVEALRAEIVRLRLRCVGLERSMQDLVSEADQLDSAITAVSNFRQHLTERSRTDDQE
ncbi:hypothetical protein B0A52_04705 [Exophiala mesophila]|uniref:Uncharacterized protein n=1 Tax=Exophiala mesophila TaxID=212818 RepID=A0A438N8L0_EXOME|nr:hypothetical protein B0A52_04705 [Exophiala mesophila]